MITSQNFRRAREAGIMRAGQRNLACILILGSTCSLRLQQAYYDSASRLLDFAFNFSLISIAPFAFCLPSKIAQVGRTSCATSKHLRASPPHIPSQWRPSIANRLSWTARVNCCPFSANLWMMDAHGCLCLEPAGHLMGRLASIVAKQILNGQKIVLVRCEEVNVSGSFFRMKVHLTTSTCEGLLRIEC